jgi:hypothetical protein
MPLSDTLVVLLQAAVPYIIPTAAAVGVYIFGHLPAKKQAAVAAKVDFLRGLMLDIVTTVEQTSKGLAGPDKAIKAQVAFKAAVEDLGIAVPKSLVTQLLEPAVAHMKQLLAGSASAPSSQASTPPQAPSAGA